MSKEITAQKAADWWTERLEQGDKNLFNVVLFTLIKKGFEERDCIILTCDYDPQDILLHAVRAAGVECEGHFFSARGILPQKTSLRVLKTDSNPKRDTVTGQIQYG